MRSESLSEKLSPLINDFCVNQNITKNYFAMRKGLKYFFSLIKRRKRSVVVCYQCESVVTIESMKKMKDDDLEDTYFDIAIENEFEFLIEQDEVDVCYIKNDNPITHSFFLSR